MKRRRRRHYSGVGKSIGIGTLIAIGAFGILLVAISSAKRADERLQAATR